MSGRSDEEALKKAAEKFNVAKEKIKLERGVWTVCAKFITSKIILLFF